MRNYSNRFFFNQTSIPDQAHFNTLSDALTAAYKAILPTGNQIVETIGYQGGSDIPAFSKTYALAGTWTPGANDREATPDSAILVRFGTTQRSVKNHPIYLFKYFHHAFCQGNVSPDAVSTAQKALVDTFGTALLTGFSDGVTTYVLAGPRGAVAQNRLTESYLTHRDFPA